MYYLPVCIEVGVVAVFAGLEEITGRLFTDNGYVFNNLFYSNMITL